MKPAFLSLSEIIELHGELVKEHGGLLGIRDQGLLESALAMPRASWGGRYLHESLFEMAAAYLFHLVGNHPFLDGNKRTGAAAALVFLAMNRLTIRVSNKELERLAIAVANNRIDKPALAGYFRKSCRPRKCRRPPGPL